MVGGFATSDYLFSRLEDHFKTKNIHILRPDTFLWAKILCFTSIDSIVTTCIRNKAVAEGAIIFRLDHLVSSRVSKYTYGIEASVPFNPSLADHLAREDTCYEDSTGETLVPDHFSPILQKVDFTPFYAMHLLIFNRISRFQRRRSSGNVIT